ncbi:thiol-disulfide isomerase [Pseudonocardia sp. MH-G8]|nr:thiol-disulfide isomerase [Pseudonocardia sp. MH-G8]
MLTRADVRATIVVVVLAVAGVVALWPRDSGREALSTRTPGPHVSETVPAPDNATLAPLRARAALDPCPAPDPAAPPPSGPLAGIVVPCLGAPGEVDLGAALAGRPALLNLWASWCPSCKEEMPVLDAYAAEPDAVAVIGVNVRDLPEAALSMLADGDVRFPSVTDPDGALQRALDAPPVIPLSYVVRPDGSVQLVPPKVFRTVEEVRQAVAEHLPSDPH